MALKRTPMPLTALVLAAFTHEETRHFVQALQWAEQSYEVGNTGSTGGWPESGEASTWREALVPFANWLFLQTRGQALYLVETLKELLVRAIIVPALQEQGSWGLLLRTRLLAQTPVSELIPSSVRELIRSQLAQLTPSAWTLLVAGAALGQGLTFERLMQVAQLDEQEGLRALEELVSNGLLLEGAVVEEAQALDEYAFPREMLRQVVYQEAGATRQRLVQRRVSAVIREEIEDDRGEEARLPRPAPINGPAETRNGQGRRGVARAVPRENGLAGSKGRSRAATVQSSAAVGVQSLP